MLLSIIKFCRKYLKPIDVRGLNIIEVGAYNVNGSLRPFVEALGPASYLGVDLSDGPGVDRAVAVEKLEETFGKESFDVVIATELLEHVRDWRLALSNLKGVCKKGGIILISSPSKGFFYHGFPDDFWRFELEDLAQMFSDCRIMVAEKNPTLPGALIKVRKLAGFVENDLSDHQLYSIVSGERTREIDELDFDTFRFFMFSLTNSILFSFPIKYAFSTLFYFQKKRANAYYNKHYLPA